MSTEKRLQEEINRANKLEERCQKLEGLLKGQIEDRARENHHNPYVRCQPEITKEELEENWQAYKEENDII